jgi:hypothetical protein
MSAPPVHGPRDEPALRNWLVRQWLPGGPFDQAAELTVGRLGPGASLAESARMRSAWNREALGESRLWWVGADLVDLIQASAESLPPVELHPELVPAAPTLVVFERPLHGTDAMKVDEPVLVDALMWGNRLIPTTDWAPAPGIVVMMYRRIDFDEGLSAQDLVQALSFGALDTGRQVGTRVTRDTGAGRTGVARVTGEAWVPLGMTDWRHGDDWSTPVMPGIEECTAASAAEDRRWLAVLWSLASQQGLVDSRVDAPDRHERRRAARAGYSTPDVRVVRLRSGVASSAGLKRESTGKRTYRVRWIVKPHWRQQPYGPGRSLRRPVLIGPYIKGPEGAPLHRTETVRVLDGGTGGRGSVHATAPAEPPVGSSPADRADDLRREVDPVLASEPPGLEL